MVDTTNVLDDAACTEFLSKFVPVAVARNSYPEHLTMPAVPDTYNNTTTVTGFCAIFYIVHQNAKKRKYYCATSEIAAVILARIITEAFTALIMFTFNC